MTAEDEQLSLKNIYMTIYVDVNRWPSQLTLDDENK